MFDGNLCAALWDNLRIVERPVLDVLGWTERARRGRR